MQSIPLSIAASAIFLIANVIVLLAILRKNRTIPKPIPPLSPGERILESSELLSWEFEYARTTASEAMNERHTIMNFYLLAVAVVTSGIVAVLGRETTLPTSAGAVLLWALCGIGWFYFLMIVRLRQAWHDSARAMNQIKDFYINHAQHFTPDELGTAFYWKTNTLPRPGKSWTVYFYSATLIGFLNSVAFALGGALIELDISESVSPLSAALLAILSIVFFAFHVGLYYALLRESPPAAKSAAPSTHIREEAIMSSGSNLPDKARPWVQILEEEVKYRFDTLFRVVQARLRYRRFDGKMSEPVTRLNFERGDSVGVLLYDPGEDAVVLVRQFRYPVYAGLAADARAGDGAQQAWLLEIVAGVKDADRGVEDVAHKELLEEAGYNVIGALQHIATIYPSPGGTSERIHLYLGNVDHRRQAGQGGGVVAEGEDTQVVVLPFQQAMEMVARGEIRDAKTIVALQHLALRKD